MALDLTAEQKELGKGNANAAVGELTRRGFMKSAAIASGALIPVAAATYYGYQATEGKPIKAALIGCGDEGGVLMGDHDPKYIEFIALCDIRPYNQKRIIAGEPAPSPRKGYTNIYGKDKADDVKDKHMYTSIEEMLNKEKDLEAVVIALPLHLHSKVAIQCMRAGKHVLCEKLMARTVSQCKEMIKVAKETNRILSIGHQRHYSLLYAHATELIQSGVIGDIKHIRALWHRNFSWLWKQPADGKSIVDKAPGIRQPAPMFRDGWFQPILTEDYNALKDSFAQYDYKSMEELVRWRLYNRTGGGLMAELGSHQLDASSIFLGKVKPLSVMGVGTRSFFGDVHDETNRRNPRGIDDQVFVTFEFPGKNHPRGPHAGTDKDDVVVVTYSSISTNGFEPYGETVMGTRGTLITAQESELMLFKEQEPGKAAKPRDTKVTVSQVGNKPAVEAASTWGGPGAAAAAAGGGAAGAGGPVSRGYKEEMADFAHCIRLWKDSVGYKTETDAETKKEHYIQRLPRCHGEVAMADAILALTANIAMAKHQRIEFDPEWFKADNDKAPDTGMTFAD
ncbi:MAG TPA: Gfo/Idh/MocA family oxidoreductase [Gemmataceae bacterium]|jgi:predicted dehydrogenase|nr:Gfo/Idh/MocA family oxidoreductase [Gemmataceae bacterium]